MKRACDAVQQFVSTAFMQAMQTGMVRADGF
jgi:hypothetical protein